MAQCNWKWHTVKIVFHIDRIRGKEKIKIVHKLCLSASKNKICSILFLELQQL